MLARRFNVASFRFDAESTTSNVKRFLLPVLRPELPALCDPREAGEPSSIFASSSSLWAEETSREDIVLDAKAPVLIKRIYTNTKQTQRNKVSQRRKYLTSLVTWWHGYYGGTWWEQIVISNYVTIIHTIVWKRNKVFIFASLSRESLFVTCYNFILFKCPRC